MTTAPKCLLDTRAFLLATTYSATDPLSSSDLGIIGNSLHVGGYHCGDDRVVSGDYSVIESPRDRAGLTSHASALDIGKWSTKINGVTFDLRHMSRWLVAECKANAPDTLDIREIIYSPDGTTVKRWDRLLRRIGGDSSHLYHTHLSIFRDATKAGRGLIPLFKRYFTSIGLLEDIVTPDDFVNALKDPRVANLLRALPWQYPVTPQLSMLNALTGPSGLMAQMVTMNGQISGLTQLVQTLATQPATTLTPEQMQQLLTAITDASRAGAAELADRIATAARAEADALLPPSA